MELSKEVHGLLNRIKRISNAQKTSETYLDSVNPTYYHQIEFNPEELINIDEFDTSDRESWLYASDGSNISSDTDINEWLQSENYPEPSIDLSLDSDKYEFKKNVDTRTFTRPKKKICRPSLEMINDNYTQRMDIESLKIPEHPFINLSLRNDVSISTGPLHFKLSDPVMNQSFDKILLTASDGYDSFLNMSPPSLVNSLCSSQFLDTSLSHVPNDTFTSESNEDIFLKNNDSQIEEIMPPLQITMNQKDSVDSMNETVILTPNKMSEKFNNTLILNDSPLNKTTTLTPQNKDKINEKANDLNQSSTPKIKSPNLNITFDKEESKSSVNLNTTYEKNSQNKTLNSTFTTSNQSKENSLNSTFTKNNTFKKPDSFRMNTFLKKPRNITNLPEALKKSCPNINHTFQTVMDKSFTKNFQKLSDSQPNLTKDVKPNPLNTSLELVSTESYEGYSNARTGSTDSLDEKSSSISSSSKESGSKILNMGDLDNLARLQEQSLHQIMSTPKPRSLPRFFEAEPISPITRSDDYFSEDSDLSDPCVTARSRNSRQSSSSISSRSGSLTKLVQPKTTRLETLVMENKPKVLKEASEFGKLIQPKGQVTDTTRNVPTMIVKPLEVDRTFKLPEKPTIPQVVAPARPRVRTSGLPRPTAAVGTGIPRPASRIPAPRQARPQITRPSIRPPSKNGWMDGCY